MHFVALLLVAALITSSTMPVSAATPKSTMFIEVQSTSLDRTANTELKVFYSVASWTLLEKLGVFSISIQRSSDQQTWQTESAFYYFNNPEFVGENTGVHSGNFYYNGTRGYYYRAYIVFFASKDGSGEKTYMTTNTVYIPPLGNGGRTN